MNRIHGISFAAMAILCVLAFAMLVSAQAAPQKPQDWPIGIPNPWQHVESGPDKSHYADGLIDWLHFAGAGEHPEQDPLATSYYAHMRLGDNATTLIPGSPPEWRHELPASPYLPPEQR